MTSVFTTGSADLLSGALAKIIDAGYPFNPLTTSLDLYLGTALAGLTSGSNLHLTMTRAQLLAGLTVALGGSGNALTTSELQLLTSVVDSGAGYTGPLDIVPGAVVAYSQRAMAAAWVTSAITIRRDSDDTTISFATDASNAVDQSAIATFLGTTHYQVIGVSIADGGSGYDDGVTPSTFDATVVGGNGTASVVNVTTDGLGVVVFNNSITTPGSYTGLPDSPASTTGDDGVHHGTGLTFNLIFGVLDGGGFVASLHDQSGNASDATQATAGLQPQWIPAALGGAPGILFDGVATLLKTAGNTLWNTNAFSFYFVVAFSGTSNAQQYVLGVNANAGSSAGPDLNLTFSPSVGSPPRIGGWGTSTDNAGFSSGAGGNFTTNEIPGLPACEYRLFATRVANAGYGSGSENGAAMAGNVARYGDGTTGIVNLPLAIGASDAVSPSLYLGGVIMEAIGYDSTLSDADDLAVIQNIAAYYGITLL